MPPRPQTLIRRIRSWMETSREPSLSVLLALQVAYIFLVRPLISVGTVPYFVRDWFLFAIAFISVFVVSSGGWARIAALGAFGLVAVVSVTDRAFIGGLPVHILSIAVNFLFTLVVTVIIGRAVFGVGRVTHHHIQGAIVVYLNLALLFASIYGGLADLIPRFFVNLSPNPQAQFEQLLYFSLGALTTATAGDITPLDRKSVV